MSYGLFAGPRSEAKLNLEVNYELCAAPAG